MHLHDANTDDSRKRESEAYDLTIDKEGDVLWVTARGRRSLETVLAMSKDILAACAEKKAKRALIDVRTLEGRLATMEAFDIVEQHFPKLRDRSAITRAAIVDLKEFEGSYRFFEDVAVNRGFALRIFSDPDKAVEWLKS